MSTFAVALALLAVAMSSTAGGLIDRATRDRSDRLAMGALALGVAAYIPALTAVVIAFRAS